MLILNENKKQKNKAKDLVVIALTFIFFLSACGAKQSCQNIEKAEIRINDKIITAEVVRTMEAQAKGLSGKEKLEENEGMLFLYENKKRPTFWMKDMLFPIDIIWICDDEVVDLTENLPIPQGGDIKTVTPGSMVNYILEVNAGFIEENELKVGDIVRIDLIDL